MSDNGLLYLVPESDQTSSIFSAKSTDFFFTLLVFILQRTLPWKVFLTPILISELQHRIRSGLRMMNEKPRPYLTRM